MIKNIKLRKKINNTYLLIDDISELNLKFYQFAIK